jgi:acetoin utilization protein AcuC
VDRIGIVYGKGIVDYDFSDQPVGGEKFPNYLRLLESRGILKRHKIELFEPIPADEGTLQLVHTKEYIDYVEKTAATHGYLDEDTMLTPENVGAVRLIVGSALKASQLVINGTLDLVQAIGGGLHHAGRDHGGGFCVYNDVAICAKYLLEYHNLRRILIFDTDAHAGNGTMEIFYRDPRVLTLSVHEDPRFQFPGSGFSYQIGEEAGKGYAVNVPLPTGAGDACMRQVLERVYMPLVDQFEPEIIIRTGGADPHFQDELAGLSLTFQGLWTLGRTVVDVAEKAGCGLIDLVCSGYNLGTEEKGLYSLFMGELGLDLDLVESMSPEVIPEVVEETERIINELADMLEPYWLFNN